MQTKIFTITEKKIDVKALEVLTHVESWGDSTVNGVQDMTGDMIPFRRGDQWAPVIDIDGGKVKDWPVGTTAMVRYKVKGKGSYAVVTTTGERVDLEGSMVPAMLYPEYDYPCDDLGGFRVGFCVMLDIDQDGNIQKWKLNDILQAISSKQVNHE